MVPREQQGPLSDRINGVCINLESSVSVAEYLVSEHLGCKSHLAGRAASPPGVSVLLCRCPAGNTCLILADETDSQGWRSPLKAISDFFKGGPKGDTETGLNSH